MSKQATQKQTPPSDHSIVFWALSGALLSYAYFTHGKFSSTIFGEPRNEDVKPFTNLTSFYDRYLLEHRDPTCRQLHVLGTTFVLATLAMKFRDMLPNFVAGISLGMILCEYLAPLTNGLCEFAVIFATVALVCKLRKQPFPWQLLFLGYFPAWVGHFFFEENRPATFIYPTYSLLSDFAMWYQMITGQLPWSQSL